MKTRSRFYCVRVICMILAFNSCKDHTELDISDPASPLLSGKWRVRQVEVGVRDVSGSFEDLTLIIDTDHTYRVSRSQPPIWPEHGSFSLMVDQNTRLAWMKRHDGFHLLIKEITDTTLILEFAYPPTSSGRISSVEGSYRFVFDRQQQ